MSNVVRLISASKSDFETMTPMDLKESIYSLRAVSSWASTCCLQAQAGARRDQQ